MPLSAPLYHTVVLFPGGFTVIQCYAMDNSTTILSARLYHTVKRLASQSHNAMLWIILLRYSVLGYIIVKRLASQLYSAMLWIIVLRYSVLGYIIQLSGWLHSHTVLAMLWTLILRQSVLRYVIQLCVWLFSDGFTVKQCYAMDTCTTILSARLYHTVKRLASQSYSAMHVMPNTAYSAMLWTLVLLHAVLRYAIQ